jgi:type I restriction enzyme, S subunit
MRWVYYALQCADINGLDSGSAIPSTSRPDVYTKKVLLPPVPEQRRIAGVLGALDDKIELNRKMNRTLEEMAQALFKSWFIDFDGHDDLVDSELGPIPKGWEVSSVYDFAKVIYGAPFKSKLFNEDGEGLPLIRNRDLKTQKPGKYTTEQNSKAHLVRPGDVLVSMDAEFRPYIWLGAESLLNQRVCAFVPKAESNLAYVYHAIRDPLLTWERGKVGTTVIHLGKRDIDTIKVIQPPEDRLERYGKAAGPIIEKIVLTAQETNSLTQLRDTLLPKLISGEIRVPEAEEAAEAAL